jgi:subtilisin family serine protease
VNGDSDPNDDDGHGTHVSGTIAATGNNGIGYVGVMWDASLIACKFLDRDGFGTTAGAIECLDYFSDLKDSGIDVVATNNSWGGSANSTLLRNAIALHRNKGILFVAAAGNDGVDTDQSPHYPSSYDLDNIISVAAIDSIGQLAFFSNYGRNSVDIAAPGVGI